MGHRVLFTVAPQFRSFMIEGPLLQESFKDQVATRETHGTLAQAASSLDAGLEHEVPGVKISTRVMVPMVVVLVHPGNDRVRRRVGDR